MDEWVAVADRMPDVEGEYWVWVVPAPPQPSLLVDGEMMHLNFKPHGRVLKTCGTQDGKKRFNCGLFEMPTHWTTLPLPPEVQG